MKRVPERRKAEGRCLVCRTAGIVVDCSWNGEWLWGVMFWSWRSRKDEVIKDLVCSVSGFTILRGCSTWTNCIGQEARADRTDESLHEDTVEMVLDSQRGLGRSDGPGGLRMKHPQGLRLGPEGK